MNSIDLTFVGYAGFILAIGLAAIVVVVFYFRRSHNRDRKALEARRGYNCLSAKMAWGSDDNPADDRIKRILADRTHRRASTTK